MMLITELNLRIVCEILAGAGKIKKDDMQKIKDTMFGKVDPIEPEEPLPIEEKLQVICYFTRRDRDIGHIPSTVEDNRINDIYYAKVYDTRISSNIYAKTFIYFRNSWFWGSVGELIEGNWTLFA